MKNSNKTSFYKYFIVLFVSLSILFVTTVFILPMVASSDFGKKKIENYISEQLDASVSFESLHISFFGTQQVKGLKIVNLQGNSALTLDSASVDSSLPEMFFYGFEKSLIAFSDLNLTVQNEVTLNEATPLAIQLKNVTGEFSLSPLLVKLSGDSAQGKLEGHFETDIALDGLDLDELFTLVSNPEMLFSHSTQLKATLNAKNFPVALLDFGLSLHDPESTPGFFTSLLGNKIDVALNELKTGENNHLILAFEALSPNMTANIVGELGLNKIFTTKPSTLWFMVDQQLIERTVHEDLGFTLSAPTAILVGLEEFSLPFNLKHGEYDLSKLSFKGKVDVQEATLISKTALPDLALHKISANITTDENSENLTLKIHGNASEQTQPIKIAIETVIPKSLDFKKHPVPPMLVDLNHIPVAMIDHFFGWNQALSKAIGTHADLKIEARAQKEHLDVRLDFNSERLTLSSMQLKIDDHLAMMEPPVLKLHLSEEFAQRFVPENAFLNLDVKEPIELSFYVSPIENIREIGLELPNTISGEIGLASLSFNNKKTNEITSFKDIHIPWEIDTETKEINLKFSGISKHSIEFKTGSFSGLAAFKQDDNHHIFDIALKQQNAAGQKSNLALKGDVEDLFTDEGSVNLNNLGLNLDAKIENLPTPLFCKVAGLNKRLHKKIEVLFGDILNGSLHVSIKALNGQIQADVSGQEGAFTLDSKLEDDFLFLNKPFRAHFTVTPRLGKSILHDALPFLDGVVSSDQPIIIDISNEGFAFPIKDLDLTKIEVSHASLSLGHVKFDKTGELGNVLGLLTPSNSDLVSVWFTPIYFNMHTGVFRLERVDMLISNQFPIAAWGRVNLIQDKVKMMIGMSGYALKHAFKIKTLDNDFMLQIPLIGKTSSATIDKPTATAKIGALVAQSHGGPKGLVLGTVLSLAGGALSEKRTPKPTTDPLPWANELKKHETEDVAESGETPKTNK